MIQNQQNDVKQVTQLIISELLKNFNSTSESMNSINTIADLFIQSVIDYNLFMENSFFTRELKIITEVEAAEFFKKIKSGDSQLIKELGNYIDQTDAKKNQYEVPYEYITDYVYSNQLLITYEIVEERLSIFAECIDNKISSYDDYEIKTLDKVFRKFRRHLLLAINQKKYIDDVTSAGAREAELLADNARGIADNARGIADEARGIADNARGIADIAKLVAFNAKITANNAEDVTVNVKKALIEAQEGAQKALNLSSNANVALNKVEKIANKAEETAKQAQNLANEADLQAKSTIANYISILGIFASIIFTLFGGVNLIGATVKLLEANSKWPYLTFIIALLMICLLTLLNMMIKWINSMNNLKGALDKLKLQDREGRELSNNLSFFKRYIGFGFYTRSVLVLSIVLGISMIGMYNVKKENNFNYSSETTTKVMPTQKNSKGFNMEEKNQENETTIVKKITISNFLNDSNSKSE